MAIQFKADYAQSADNWNRYADAGQSYWEKQANLGLNSSENQAALQALRDVEKDALSTSVARNAVMGGTDAARQMAVNNATDKVANATSEIAKNTTANSQNAMSNYLTVMKQGTEGVNQAIDAQKKEDLEKYKAKMAMAGAGISALGSMMKLGG